MDDRSLASSLSSPAPSAAAAASMAAQAPRLEDKSVDASLGKNMATGQTYDSQLESDYDSLRAAHSALLQRVQSDSYSDENSSDEAARLRVDLQQLRKDLENVTQERDELKIAVRDLRVRVEESRRAVMRLQSGNSTAGGAGVSGSASTGMVASPSMGFGPSAFGGMPSSSSNTSVMSPVEPSFSAASTSKADKRRTIGPGGLPSWNPREINNQPGSAGLGITAEPAVIEERSTPPNDVDVDAKRAKRASLAFGPYAANVGTVGRKAHRRNPSGESEISTSASVQESPNIAPGSSGAFPVNGSASTAGGAGLRGLRLGGASNPPSVVSTAPTNKRASFVGTSIFRSPQPNAAELNAAEPQQPAQSTLGSLLMPMRSMSLRRSSNSSSMSGGSRAASGHEGDTFLGLPRSVSRASSTSGSPGNTSPVMDRREGETEAHNDQGIYAGQYRQPSVLDSNRGSLLQSVPPSVQKQLNESRERLADRETQLHSLRKEMLAMRLELEETKKARAASDACLKALREFANRDAGSSSDANAEGPVDMLRGVKLPPLPTDDLNEEDEEEEQKPAQSPMLRQTSVQSEAPPSTWKTFSRQFGSFSAKRASIVAANAPGPPGSVNYAGKDATTSPQQSSNGLAPMPLLGKPRSPSVSTTALPGVASPDHATPRSPQMRSPRLGGFDTAGSSGALGLAREPPSPRRAVVGRYRNGSGSSSSSTTAGPNSAISNPRRLSMQQQQRLAHDADPSGPSARALKAMEAANHVDEDSGFVAPSFA